MPVEVTAVLAEIDDVLTRCGASKDQPSVPRNPRPHGTVSSMIGNPALMASACLAAIERNAPHRSYIDTARKWAHALGQSNPYFGDAHVNALIGVLVSVRQDIEAGYIKTLEQRARETVFGDFLEMATEINAMFAPSAVVLAVSILEEHVRKSAEVNGIAVIKPNGRYRSFEDMTNALRDEDVLSLPEQRQAGTWYAQRTAAAHGRFEEVVHEEVPRIIDGVRDFLVRHPA